MRELAEKLVREKKAYYCFCTSEELEKMRDEAAKNNLPPKYNRKCTHLTQKEIEEKLANNTPKVIRLLMPDNTNYEWDDIVRGKISIPSSALTDPVILKSNGVPTYNFAVVCDDNDMQITHVLRGEEHISNTPYQIAIKNALNFTNKIEYGHLSIIVDETGKKLSKRNKELKQFIEDYKNAGYVPEAITNFLVLLG
jgi:glutamyl-tRNA synthetase